MQGEIERQMSGKAVDENDEVVEVCVRQILQIPHMDSQYWVKLLLHLMIPKARTVINRVALTDRDNYKAVKAHPVTGKGKTNL